MAGVGDLKLLCASCRQSGRVEREPVPAGIYFLHEYGYGIYVANIVPNSAASHCAAIANGNDQDWNFLMRRFREVADDGNERKNILAGLTCSKEMWTLQVLEPTVLL